MERFPESVRNLTENMSYTADCIGKSGSRVLLYSDMVLKIEPMGMNAEKELQMLTWLQGRLPVPDVICAEERSGMHYLLMTRLPGAMACTSEYMNQPQKLVKLLAESIHMLWNVEVGDCPCETDVRTRLDLVREDVERGLIGMEDAEPETYGKGGFSDPQELYRWLENNVPRENLVFSHGDLCLPNVFFAGDTVSGFLDLGNAGLADPYQDLALCWRSLKHNCSGKYCPDGVTYPEIQEDMLFSELGIVPDWDKLRYYILLDELF